MTERRTDTRMGTTTDLRRHLKREFDPFVAARGFTRDDRDSPSRQIYRRLHDAQMHVFDIQWEKYGSPRFVVNFGTGSREGIERDGVIVPARDLAPEDFGYLARLRPGTGRGVGSWFRQDPPWWQALLSRGRLKDAGDVVRQLCDLFGELEAYWARGTVGPHMILESLGAKPTTVAHDHTSA